MRLNTHLRLACSLTVGNFLPLCCPRILKFRTHQCDSSIGTEWQCKWRDVVREERWECAIYNTFPYPRPCIWLCCCSFLEIPVLLPIRSVYFIILIGSIYTLQHWKSVFPLTIQIKWVHWFESLYTPEVWTPPAPSTNSQVICGSGPNISKCLFIYLWSLSMHFIYMCKSIWCVICADLWMKRYINVVNIFCTNHVLLPSTHSAQIMGYHDLRKIQKHAFCTNHRVLWFARFEGFLMN